MKKPRSTFFLIKTVLPRRYCYESCAYRTKKVYACYTSALLFAISECAQRRLQEYIS